MKQVLCQVISNNKVMPETHLIWLACPKIAQSAKPGQFVMVGCGEDTLLPRPFSIHQVINKEDIALYFAVLEDGKGTSWLAQRKPGESLKMFGPLGNGFSISADSKNLLLVAGGMGIAPLYFLAEEAIKQDKEVTLLYGTAITNPYPGDQLTSRIKLVIATEDGTAGHHGLVTDLLPNFTKKADQIFACGPLPMYQTMAQMPELKNKSVQVSLETRMACGRGLCYGCSVKTKQGQQKVCSDGPVFNLDDILWDELVLL